ncbi:MAG: hypothetical protein A2X80_04100 [Geobacteraceae bacterium GWB2_52_12]|nr:MAG: hypothetical protein A2X80_04100 [Geobacteraceae bacterium GWB2_52_12]
MKDATMLYTLEEQHRQNQKMDSIGTLAGGIAHDFNNIMTVIIGACALLEMSAANNPEQIKLVGLISDSADRAAKLTKSLLAFSRRQNINKQPEDLVSVIATMQDSLDRISGDAILLTTYLPDEPLMVMIDRGQMEQVLMSLAANARDAMPLGGLLNIAASLVESEQRQFAQGEIIPCRYALITVSDTGEGIDNNTQLRIFEPYFTTKVIGQGTGLALSTAYGIVRRHDGMINVYSAPGDGTTFKIYLPLHEQIETEASAVSNAPAPEKSSVR